MNVSGTASWEIDVAHSGLVLSSGRTRIVGHEPRGDNMSGTVETLVFRADSVGTYTISLSGLLVSEDFASSPAGGSVTVNVTAPVQQSPEQNPANEPGRTEVEAPVRSSNNNVTGITVSIGELYPEFNRNVMEYTLHVGYEVTYVDISAMLEDSNARYEVEGNTELQVGENIATLTAIAEDGTRRVYTITIIRADEAVLRLASLTVNGFSLTPAFQPDILEYRLTLPEFRDFLEVIATAEDEGVTIEIVGATNLRIGENIIIIILTSEDGEVTTEYRIIVYVPEPVIEPGFFERIFGGITTEIWMVTGISILTLATIIMLIVEKCKEGKPKRARESEELGEDIVTNDYVGEISSDNSTGGVEIEIEAAETRADKKKKQGKRYM
ncbi:MAG: cadherin-like beta sandwich domain-containing protein [Oscillospiraceae bacterium]|nr:cadherin-like beta sandwich domain-containing protein [Oscillospiraceae bacterium]